MIELLLLFPIEIQVLLLFGIITIMFNIIKESK